jgi:hypothetical protein
VVDQILLNTCNSTGPPEDKTPLERLGFLKKKAAGSGGRFFSRELVLKYACLIKYSEFASNLNNRALKFNFSEQVLDSAQGPRKLSGVVESPQRLPKL